MQQLLVLHAESEKVSGAFARSAWREDCDQRVQVLSVCVTSLSEAGASHENGSWFDRRHKRTRTLPTTRKAAENERRCSTEESNASISAVNEDRERFDGHQSNASIAKSTALAASGTASVSGIAAARHAERRRDGQPRSNDEFVAERHESVQVHHLRLLDRRRAAVDSSREGRA